MREVGSASPVPAGRPSSAGRQSRAAGLPSVQDALPEQRTSTRRILVVDDTHLLCEGLIRLLRHARFEGVAANSAAQALRLIERQHFDLVITDVQMPGLSGADLTEELGKTHPDLKCIVITGYATKPLIARLTAARNVVDILTKPLDTNRLITRIRSLVEG
ncbi:MAG: response regulator [Planctomycetes bacterium]|nr:response regulator [Planctomycetota bacterium]